MYVYLIHLARSFWEVLDLAFVMTCLRNPADDFFILFTILIPSEILALKYFRCSSWIFMTPQACWDFLEAHEIYFNCWYLMSSFWNNLQEWLQGEHLTWPNPLHHHQYANINQSRAYHIPLTFSGSFFLADTCMLSTEPEI